MTERPPDRDPEAGDAGRRLFFDLRRAPLRRANLNGSRRVLWALLWIVVLILALSPIPFWWFG